MNLPQRRAYTAAGFNLGLSFCECVCSALQQVDRSRTPWLVAALHRMVVAPSTDKHDLINMARLQRDLEDLFLQYKVDLVLQGQVFLLEEG